MSNSTPLFSPHSSVTDTHQVHKASNREIYLWSTSQVTNSLIGSQVQTNMGAFYITALGLDAGIVGAITVIPRIMDALLDPLIGHVSDQTHTRWGRRRPYIFVGAVLNALILAVMWWASPQWPFVALYCWLAGMILLYSIANSIFQVPVEALGIELTDDYDQRTKVQSVKFFFGAVAGLGVPWLYWLTLRPTFGGEVHGFRIVYLIVSVLVLFIGIIPALFCKERFQFSNKRSESVWSGLVTTWKNPYFRQFVYFKLSGSLAAAIFGGMNFYIGLYYICQGDKDLATKIMGIGGTLYNVLTFAFLPLLPWIGRHLGKRNAVLLGSFLCVVLAGIQPWIQTPSAPYLQLVGVVLSIPAGLLVNVFISSFLPDICDLGELQSGLRLEGTYSAVAGFLAKIEWTLLSVVVGIMVDFSGFISHSSHQTIAVQNNMRLFTYAPAFLFSCLTLWFGFRFKVDHILMRKTRAELDARAPRD